jgi:carbonic anhydrase/acetyltransferase-like protein (isoleucine patch superfamily)
MRYRYGRHEPKIAEGCFIAPSADIIGDVEIGSGTSVWFSATIRGDLNSIRIGKRSSVQDNCVIHTEKATPTEIGDSVVVGHRAIVHAAKIGGGTIIGMGAVILSRAVIGKDCIIGAGSVVTEGTAIPDGSIAIGSPAKVVKPVTREHIERIRRNVQEYAELNEAYLKEGGFGLER